MRILPTDLTTEWLVRLVSMRDGRQNAPAPPPRLGFWGKLVRKDAGLDPERAAAVMPAASTAVQGTLALIWTLGFAGFMLCGQAVDGALAVTLAAMAAPLASMGLSLLALRPLVGRIVGRPLTVDEMDRLIAQADEELPRRFLGLVRDAVRVPARPETEESVRAAIRALGEAIGRLPAVETEPLDTAAVRAEAAAIRAEAARTGDRVIAESLERRAQAMLHRAEAHDHSSLLVRRSEALRGEIEAQIDALREGLVASQGEPAGDPSGLASLAASARRVATESVNLAAARAELDAAVAGQSGVPAPPVEQQETLRARG